MHLDDQQAAYYRSKRRLQAQQHGRADNKRVEKFNPAPAVPVASPKSRRYARVKAGVAMGLLRSAL